MQDLRASGPRAVWGQHDTSIVERFLRKDPTFQRWLGQNSQKVTISRLKKTFDLGLLRKLLSLDGLEETRNSEGHPVLAVLNEKIYRKMAAVYDKIRISVGHEVP